MQELASWATPLLILPGVGLLLVSTAARYDAVHAEIHALLGEGTAQASSCAQHTLRRARLFRDAMFSLYGAAVALGAAGLIGGVGAWLGAGVHWSSWTLSLAGVASFVFAALQLMRESAVSLGVVRTHAAEIEERIA